MRTYQRIVDLLAAASIVAAFGGLFFGRLMIYPVAVAQGTFLERLAAESSAWHAGHQVMLLGMLALLPTALALRRAMHAHSPALTDVAAALAVLGAALGVGQYALDFAMLAAARIHGPAAGEQFLAALRADTLVQVMFYKLPDLTQLGLILFTVALWKQGAGWRVPAALVTVAALAALIAPQLWGAMGVRVALGLTFAAFLPVAWKIATPPLIAASASATE